MKYNPSAMKIFSITNLCILFFLLTFFSCAQKNRADISKNEPEKIVLLKYGNVGGMQGFYRTFTATQDSVHFETGQYANKTHKEWHAKMPAKTWQKITALIDLNTVATVKSSPSMQPVDGVDETFQIKTNKKTQVFVNAAEAQPQYQQLEQLKTEFEKILPEKYR